MQDKQILILGLGNEILSDDRIGIQVATDLSGIISDPCVKFSTSSLGGLEIMESIKGFGKVIFIDAIRTAGGSPGDVYHFRVSDFMETSNMSNLHDVNFITALKLGKILDLDIPDDLHIIAVEISEDREFSEKLTPRLEELYSGILKEVLELVTQILFS